MNFDERKNHYSKCGMYNGYDKKKQPIIKLISREGENK